MSTQPTTTRERLVIFQKTTNLTDHGFAMKIGVTSPAYAQYIKEGTTIGKVVLKAIEAYPDLNANWLLRGVGCMLNSTELEQWRNHGIIEQCIADDIERQQAPQQSDTSEIEQLRQRNIELERQNAVLEYRLSVLTGATSHPSIK